MDNLVGTMIPEMKLDVIPGGSLNLPGAFLGKWTILYFYPKDDTPGCTKQACGYQEQRAAFVDADLQLFGVSLDDVDSHQAFQDKFGLDFPLIADTEAKLSTALGVYGDQEWQGKVYQGLSRDSFLIDPKGKIVAEWRKVNPVESVTETIKAANVFRDRN